MSFDDRITAAWRSTLVSALKQRLFGFRSKVRWAQHPCPVLHCQAINEGFSTSKTQNSLHCVCSGSPRPYILFASAQCNRSTSPDAEQTDAVFCLSDFPCELGAQSDSAKPLSFLHLSTVTGATHTSVLLGAWVGARVGTLLG